MISSVNPKHFGVPAVLALTIIAWTGLSSAQWIADDSDWWSLLRPIEEEGGCSTPSKEKPTENNFVIADLRQGHPIREAGEKVARPSVIIERGDASTGRSQICFRSVSERGRFKLIFEEGEVASAAYLIDGGPSWRGADKCVVSPKISGNLATQSGLHLGMTAAQAERILGKPCIESNDGIEYAFDFSHLPTSDERQRLKGHGDFYPDEPFDWFGTIQIKFHRAKAYYIAILTGDTQ